MIKVLIICNRLENAKKILNNVVCQINNLQVIGIANSYLEAKSLLIISQADIIISTDQRVIKFIKQEFITYNPGIVFIGKASESLEKYPKYLLINNKDEYDQIKNKIAFFLKNSIEKSQKEKLSTLLIKLGFNFNWSGTIYLQDSILYACSYKGSYRFEKIKSDIYEEVANINNTTSDRVKWSIERAIKYMNRNHTKDSYAPIEKLLQIKYPQKPGSKQLISVIANSLDFI